MVTVGDTTREPAVDTEPIPGVIDTAVALVEVQLRVAEPPLTIEEGDTEAVMVGGRLVRAVMVIVLVAVKLPSVVRAVMVAWPAATPVTRPLTTVATVVLPDVQVTALFVAFSGATVAASCRVVPMLTVASAGVTVTPVTGTTTVKSLII
ncbi:MAG: hypothetical protein DDT25_01279 [Chloroflexi bacterium]|nr:hypothetical protein [Chloroflexota bacterium]